MSDLLNRLKDFLLDNKVTNIPEIKFLQESDITQTLNRGFTELYRNQPDNPILFLSKWLSKESKALELERKYKDNKIKRENLQLKYFQKEKHEYILKQRDEEKKKVRKDDEDFLIKEIKECKDFWLGFNHICERLKTLTKATGCYIGIYDQKRRPVKEEDDIDGHLDPSGIKVLRYIGWNNDHDFLHGQCLEPNQGVTYDLISPKPAQGGTIEAENPNPTQNQENKNPEQNQQPNPVEGEKKEPIEEEKKLEDTVNSLFIEDVVNDNRIKFFREPRLGCYIALDLTYKTSLSYNSLLSSIQCIKNYETSKAEQEARKKEWSEKQEEIKTQINELKDAKIKEEEAKKIAEEKALEAEIKEKLAQANENDPNKPPEEKKEEKKENPSPQQQANTSQGNINKKDNSIDRSSESIEALEKQLTEWTEEPVKLQDYDKEEKNIYMCLDTLGQDRLFSEEEIKYIKIIGANIRDSLEKLEQSLLEKDRDIRIKFLDDEDKLKSEEKYSDEKFEENISNYISQYYSSEEYKSKKITDEETKAFEGDLAKMRYLKNLLLEGECQNILLTFQEFEFVEYLKIFQNLFYFCKMNPLEINESHTNKLEWKKARKFWKDLFPYIKEYNPVGPKPEELKSIYKLNKIKDNLQSSIAKRDEVKSYSQTLLMLVDLILHIIQVRHDNIIDRICKVAVYKDKREQIIKNNNAIDEERLKIIEEAKKLNPNVKIPGEEEKKEGEEEKKEGEEEKKEGEEEKKDEDKENENKEVPKESEKKDAETKKEEKKEDKKEEKKEDKKEEKKEEKKESPKETEQGENKEGEQKENEENNKDQEDSAKLAEELKKFDEENPKQEVPPEIEYDIDNDYDIEEAERDLVIKNAIEAANNEASGAQDKDKKPPAAGATNEAVPTGGANPQTTNPPNDGKNNSNKS